MLSASRELTSITLPQKNFFKEQFMLAIAGVSAFISTISTGTAKAQELFDELNSSNISIDSSSLKPKESELESDSRLSLDSATKTPLKVSSKLDNYAPIRKVGYPSTLDTRIEMVTLWINAFIPKDIPGVTLPVGNFTAIQGPFQNLSNCFLTDQRTFSSKILASSRLHSRIYYLFPPMPLPTITRATQRHKTGYTKEVKCDSAEIVCKEKDRSRRMNFASVREKYEVDPDGTRFLRLSSNLKAAANNRCVFGSPDIDIRGDLIAGIFRLPNGEVHVGGAFVGSTDEFPAFEVWMRINRGEPINILSSMPEQGKSPWNLPDLPFSSPPRKFKAVKVVKILSGRGKSDSPAEEVTNSPFEDLLFDNSIENHNLGDNRVPGRAVIEVSRQRKGFSRD